jgi:hypothetical protein
MRHRSDDEFVMDLLDASYSHFKESFDDDEKATIFVYTLGLLSRKR